MSLGERRTKKWGGAGVKGVGARVRLHVSHAFKELLDIGRGGLTGSGAVPVFFCAGIVIFHHPGKARFIEETTPNKMNK